MNKVDKIIGIDFGTSSTILSMTSPTNRFEPEIVEVDGKPFVETVIRLDQAGEIELFGTEAWEQADQDPENTFYEFKMDIGRNPQKEADKARFSGRELAVIFLRRIREKIERQHFNGSALADQNMLCVIGYPAAWNEKQRTETMAVAKEAGFPNVRGCEEPVGVVYFHHYKGELSVEKEQLMFIYDFGGGTSDVAVVKTQTNEKPRVLGIGGAINLGGRNYDQAVYKMLLQHCGMKEQENAPRDLVAVRRAARLLKEKLAAALHDGRHHVESTITLHGLRTQKRFSLTVEDFESCCGLLIERFADPVSEAMNRADVSQEDIEVSILAGGSARMHYVRKALDDLFPNDIVLQSLNPGEVVAKGLAIYGLALTGGIDSKISTKTSDNPDTVTQQVPIQEELTGWPSDPGGTQKRPTDKEKSGFWSALSGKGKLVILAVIIGICALLVPFLTKDQKEAQTEQTASSSTSQSVSQTQQDTSETKQATLEEVKNMSIEQIKERAKRGEAPAQYFLAEKFYLGNGVVQSDTQAVKWWKKGAEQGDADAQKDIGWMYENGRGVTQSDTQAVEWYSRAAEQGQLIAQRLFARMYESGRGVTQSDTQAAEWYRKAAEGGDVHAQFSLGWMYDKGRGVSQSDAQAATWYRKAAEQGNVGAQYNLGLMYYAGRGVTQSDTQAAEWFQKAAEQGDSDAQNYLGWMYDKGRGVSQSDAQAITWYRKAAEQGNLGAQYYLGLMYSDGRG